MSKDILRREFYDALYGSIAAADSPDAKTVPSPRGPLKVEPDGSVTSFFGFWNSVFRPAKRPE